MNKHITADEIQKIKMMCEYGMKTQDIAQVTGRSAQTITRNKKILVERDFVEKDNKNFRFSDPVFELLFRREYM